MFTEKCENRSGASRKRREVGLIMQANRLHKSLVGKKLGVLNMPRSQHMMIMLISRLPSTISQKELAARLQITPAAVTMTLKKLESDGYITRTVSEEDNRANRIALLPKGLEAVRLSEEAFGSVDEAMLEGISEEELSGFVKVMEKINDNLTALISKDSEGFSPVMDED